MSIPKWKVLSDWMVQTHKIGRSIEQRLELQPGRSIELSSQDYQNWKIFPNYTALDRPKNIIFIRRIL